MSPILAFEYFLAIAGGVVVVGLALRCLGFVDLVFKGVLGGKEKR